MVVIIEQHTAEKVRLDLIQLNTESQTGTEYQTEHKTNRKKS